MTARRVRPPRARRIRVLARALGALTLAGALVTPGVQAQGRAGVPRVRPAAGSYPVAVGDSVMLDAATELARRGIAVNAAVGRQFAQGIEVLRGLRASGRLPRAIVVGLGTNGPVTGAAFDAMMRVLGASRLAVFVTVKEPRWWESEVNGAIRAGVGRWPNARLADWNARAWGHPAWFWSDGIHLRPAGAVAYAGLIAATLR